MSGTPDALPAELRRKFAEIRKWQVVSKVTTVVVILLVVAMFAWFAFATDSGVRGNFADNARNQKAAEEAIPLVTPMVTASMQTIFEEAAPVYQKLATERYERVRKNLGAQAAVRFNQLPADSGKMMTERLTKALDSAIKKIEPELQAAFPSLTEAQRRDLLIVQFHDTIEERNRAIGTKLEAVSVSEQARIKGVLDKFALPPDEAAGGDEQLGKELVQTLLLLAQQELDTLGTPAPAASAPGAATVIKTGVAK